VIILTRKVVNTSRINSSILGRYNRLARYNKVSGIIFALLGLYLNLIRNLYKYSDARINLRFNFSIKVIFINIYFIILHSRSIVNIDNYNSINSFYKVANLLYNLNDISYF